jgi:MerR, DNA binding
MAESIPAISKDACTKTRHLAARKLALIEQKITELATMRDALAGLVGQCDRKLKRGTYPIIEILQCDSSVDPSASRTKLSPQSKSKTRAWAPATKMESDSAHNDFAQPL